MSTPPSRSTVQEPSTEPAVAGPPDQTFNPWSVVRLVFDHLADNGLQPVLGSSGNPSPPAAALLLALGVVPSHEGNRQVRQTVQQQLAEMRVALLEER